MDETNGTQKLNYNIKGEMNMTVGDRIESLEKEIDSYLDVIKDARDALASAELELVRTMDANSELSN